MIELKTYDGETKMNVIGSRADIAADSAVIALNAFRLFKQYSHCSVFALFQSILQELSEDYDDEKK